MADVTVPVGPNEKKRKRPRAARACELCRAKKYRCDELLPCSQCKKQKVDCIYDVADHVLQRMAQYNNTNETDQRPSEQTASKAVSRSVAEQQPTRELPSPTVTNVGSTQTHTPASTRWTQINVRPSPSTRTRRTPAVNTPENQAGNEHDVEISDVNPHTQNVEFHGKTSSIAFLAALQPQNSQSAGKRGSDTSASQPQQQSLVSMLHNEAFSPEALANVQHETARLEAERYYFRQAQIFLEGYFQNIHFIHPILDRQAFMSRCEDLWFGRPEQQPKSFVALYYSIMSLGALTKTWDEDKFDGLGRLEWSRKFFNLTRTAIGGLASMTAVESVQCLFFMAKISQNELNPSLAYLYLGWATRASFSAGFNRKQVSSADELDDQGRQIAKLWWGLYSLEIEVSFALGRPDSLGPDAYHNQIMPVSTETETAIISVMVDFARIIREVSVSIYLSDGTIQEKIAIASQIEASMDLWLQNVPDSIRPSVFETPKSRKITRSPTWAKRQKLVLEFRFHNVKMVLFRPFLTLVTNSSQDLPVEVHEAMDKCVDAARSTIELMHEMYCNHAFFRTWWYNTTYVLYAASIILCYGLKVVHKDERSEYLELGDKAVEILDAMEESTVAKNASHTVKQILWSANEIQEAETTETSNDQASQNRQRAEDNGMPQFSQFADDSLMSFLNLDENLDFFGMTFPLNSSHFPLWNSANELQ